MGGDAALSHVVVVVVSERSSREGGGLGNPTLPACARVRVVGWSIQPSHISALVLRVGGGGALVSRGGRMVEVVMTRPGLHAGVERWECVG